MEEYFQSPSPSVSSKRILYTASSWAKNNLIFLQETGSLRAIKPHVSKRDNLQSYLCMMVLDGSGYIEYEGRHYEMVKGDCAFIDCMRSYSHSTGMSTKSVTHDVVKSRTIHESCAYDMEKENMSEGLWSLAWVHFYGENMPAIYEKYIERGGLPVFTPEDGKRYTDIFSRMYAMAGSEDYIRDMKLNALLNELLAVIMEQSWHPENLSGGKKRRELVEVKAFLDEHYTEKITLDALAASFYIDKFYLSKIFKETYGITINSYIFAKRITQAKRLLRFTELSIDEIGSRVGMNDANYFSRSFKKLEGISPSEYKKTW